MSSNPGNASIEIVACNEPGPDWDSFVELAGASQYLKADWTRLARDVFGHRAYFMEARAISSRDLLGVLPLVQQKSFFGNFATSIPFFNYGGAAALDAAIRQRLMDRARQMARDLGCSYLELRDTCSYESSDWIVRTDKASMVLELPPSIEGLRKHVGSKLRSQVKRAEREQVSVRTGGVELVNAFYDVFCRNMRDLGTPVYPQRFFRAILERFPQQTLLVVIEHHGQAAAAGFLVFDDDEAEIPWASCRAESKPLGMNMKLYWELLSACILRGCKTFDFGRSTIDSGTYRFKQQWGARPRQLFWHRWERTPAASNGEVPKASALKGIALSIWKRLPLPIANAIGPMVSPGLPW